MTTNPLDIVYTRIRARVESKRSPEDWLTATAHVVHAMTDRQARIIYAALLDRPLTIHDADLAQFVAQRIGVRPRWMHCELWPGATWQPGRKSLT